MFNVELIDVFPLHIAMSRSFGNLVFLCLLFFKFSSSLVVRFIRFRISLLRAAYNRFRVLHYGNFSGALRRMIEIDVTIRIMAELSCANFGAEAIMWTWKHARFSVGKKRTVVKSSFAAPPDIDSRRKLNSDRERKTFCYSF